MVDKALENAKEIAELTGRSTKDVIADILDDGVLNNSIQENTSAIDRATVTAEKLQKLITAIVPILVLIAGSGLELGGVIDLTPAGEGDDWAWEDDDYYYPEPVRYGCTDYDAENYDETAEEDDGTCEYQEEIWGCTNDAASNYNPEATDDDGSCIPADEEPIEGCTDGNATNYNEEAEEDDGSCEYPEPEPCEPEYYDYYMGYTDDNKTTLYYSYDVDISCDEEQEVTIQFLVYVANSSHGEEPTNYTIDTYNTTYQDWDVRTLYLGSFSNGTYDVYTYLINAEGEMIKELIWPDIELQMRDEE